jgi:hypothetical protein
MKCVKWRLGWANFRSFGPSVLVDRFHHRCIYFLYSYVVSVVSLVHCSLFPHFVFSHLYLCHKCFPVPQTRDSGYSCSSAHFSGPCIVPSSISNPYFHPMRCVRFYLLCILLVEQKSQQTPQWNPNNPQLKNNERNDTSVSNDITIHRLHSDHHHHHPQLTPNCTHLKLRYLMKTATKW